jgi:organic hydroperoxide reductase OsmC/OhrA
MVTLKEKTTIMPTAVARNCSRKLKCRFQKSVLIDATTAASEADLEKVKADLHRFCPISKVLRNSGTELEEVWKVTRP